MNTEQGVRGVSITAEQWTKLTLPPKFQPLPSPSFITEAVDTSGSEMIKWIGIETESLDEGVKKFLWANNVRKLNLRDPMKQLALAEYIAVKKLMGDGEITIGPAIDIGKSDPKTGRVEIIEKRGYYGIYVEETKRPGFNFRETIGGSRDFVRVAQNSFGQKHSDTLKQTLHLLQKLVP